MIRDSDRVNIFAYQWFYPVGWRSWKSLIEKTPHSEADYNRIINNAVTLHMWSFMANSTSGTTMTEEGSVLDSLLKKFRNVGSGYQVVV